MSQQEHRVSYNGIASCRQWEGVAAFGRNMHEHPLTNYLHSELLQRHRFKEDIENAVNKCYPHLKHSPHNTAAKISDVLTNRQFRALAVFNDFFRPNGIEYQLLMSILPTQDGYTTMSFNRDKNDFSEKERLILNLIGPHIIQAYRNAEAFKKVRQTFVALECSNEPILFYGLTSREEEVLYCVSQGKSNAEVAGILNMASGTVKRHLENIYQKLGVENRTTATSLILATMKDRQSKPPS
jgi:DNA-binding CsgD family transcriptional regulator